MTPEQLPPLPERLRFLASGQDDPQSVALIEAAAEIDRLRAEMDALRRDAERYRFIRDADKSDDLIPEVGLYAMESLDDYIDAAMKETQ